MTNQRLDGHLSQESHTPCVLYMFILHRRQWTSVARAFRRRRRRRARPKFLPSPGNRSWCPAGRPEGTSRSFASGSSPIGDFSSPASSIALPGPDAADTSTSKPDATTASANLVGTASGSPMARVFVAEYRDSCPDTITTRGKNVPLLPCWTLTMFLIVMFCVEDWPA
jgi:hypothetical protein